MNEYSVYVRKQIIIISSLDVPFFSINYQNIFVFNRYIRGLCYSVDAINESIKIFPFKFSSLYLLHSIKILNKGCLQHIILPNNRSVVYLACCGDCEVRLYQSAEYMVIAFGVRTAARGFCDFMSLCTGLLGCSLKSVLEFLLC